MSRPSFKVVCATPNALWDFDKRQLKKIMRQAGAEVSAAAKALIRSSGGGRHYGGHIASVAGNAPASDTGNLIRSIKVRPFRSGLGVSVAATAQSRQGQPYAVFLEAGAQYQTNSAGRPKRAHSKRQYTVKPTAGMTTIEPRPFLSVALAARGASLGSRVAAAVQSGVAFKKMKP